MDTSALIRVNQRTYAHCVAAACIGVVAWRETPAFIALSVMIPVLILWEQSRVDAFLVGFAYYAAADWPLIPGVLSYFGPAATIFQAFLVWAIPSLALPLPWVACWSADASPGLWRVPLAYLLSVAPPIGIIGWASPLTAAGILFPGWAGIGLALFIAVSALALQRPVEATLTAALLTLAANLGYPGDPSPPPSWEGVVTAFDRVSDPRNPMPEFQVAERIQQRALASHREVIVFPESTVPKWTEATELLWGRTLDELRAHRKTLVIGVSLPIRGTPRCRNAVLVVGNRVSSRFFQRIPVPVIMWNPMKPKQGEPLSLFGPGVLEIKGQRVALLVLLRAAADLADSRIGPRASDADRRPGQRQLGDGNANSGRAASRRNRLGKALPTSENPGGELMTIRSTLWNTAGSAPVVSPSRPSMDNTLQWLVDAIAEEVLWTGKTGEANAGATATKARLIWRWTGESQWRYSIEHGHARIRSLGVVSKTGARHVATAPSRPSGSNPAVH